MSKIFQGIAMPSWFVEPTPEWVASLHPGTKVLKCQFYLAGGSLSKSVEVITSIKRNIQFGLNRVPLCGYSLHEGAIRWIQPVGSAEHNDDDDVIIDSKNVVSQIDKAVQAELQDLLSDECLPNEERLQISQIILNLSQARAAYLKGECES